MGRCEYWWLDDESGWCEMMSGGCICGGQEGDCSLTDNAVSAALVEEEKSTLQELALRAKKRRAAEG